MTGVKSVSDSIQAGKRSKGDLPHVVEGAGAVLRAAGVADRCEIVGGSFFEAVPAGADAYILQTVIHDWDDEQSVRILQTCRRSMGEGAKLLVIEQIVPTGNEYHSSKFDDLNMLVLFRGRERTVEEFRRLLTTAGFTLSRILPTSSPWSVLEAVPQ